MNKFIEIELDQKSAKAVQKSFKDYGKDAVEAIKRGVMRTALAIETDAKRRLRGELGSARHWITGRLAASVHTEMEGENTFEKKQESKSGDGKLGVNVGGLEAAVGTNVEYADKIEFEYDSFLRFAGERQQRKFPKRVEEEINRIK